MKVSAVMSLPGLSIYELTRIAAGTSVGMSLSIVRRLESVLVNMSIDTNDTPPNMIMNGTRISLKSEDKD
jgi:hypothetical protein